MLPAENPRLRPVGNHQSQPARRPLRLAGIHPSLSHQVIQPPYLPLTTTRLRPVLPNWQGFSLLQPKGHLHGLQVLSTDPEKFSRLLANRAHHLLMSHARTHTGRDSPVPAYRFPLWTASAQHRSRNSSLATLANPAHRIRPSQPILVGIHPSPA